MKKNTIQTLINYLNGETVANIDEIKAELVAELERGARKAQANRDLYASAHDAVIAVLASVSVPVTMSELYEAVKDELPEGFTKGKVQYAVTRLWTDEIAKVEGKISAYTLK